MASQLLRPSSSLADDSAGRMEAAIYNDPQRRARFEAYSRLQSCAVAFGEQLPLPEIVVVGGQSDGKSSLLEALLGFRFNIREVEMGTRRPLILQMMHRPDALQPLCRLQDEHSDAYGPVLHPLSAVAAALKQRTHDHLLSLRQASTGAPAAGSAGASGGGEVTRRRGPIVSSKPIVMRVEYAFCASLTLIDTPGFILKARRGEPESTPADIEAMVVELMVPPHRLIVFLQQSSVEWCSSLWLDVVRRADPQLRRTVIVASKFDNRLKVRLGKGRAAIISGCSLTFPVRHSLLMTPVVCEQEFSERWEVDRYLSTGGYFHSATSPPPATAAAAASPFVSPRPAPASQGFVSPGSAGCAPLTPLRGPFFIALPKDTKDRDKEKGAAGVGSTGSTERDGGASEGVQESAQLRRQIAEVDAAVLHFLRTEVAGGFDERRYGAQIGFAKLKAFLEDEMQRRYSAAAPAVLAQLERRCADVAEQVACVEQRLSAASDVASMRRLAMRHVVATTSAMLSLLDGAVEPDPSQWGLSTHEEQAASTVGHWPGVPPHAFLHAARSLRRCKGEDGEEGEEEREEEEGEGVGDGSGVGGSGGSRGGVVNEGLRLYGGAALMRVVHEFSIAAWAVPFPNTSREKVANALLAKQAAFGSSGVSGVSSAAVAATATEVARAAVLARFAPLMDALCARIAFLLRRLLDVALQRVKSESQAKQSHHTGFFQSPAAHQSASPSGTVVAPCVALEPFLGFHAALRSAYDAFLASLSSRCRHLAQHHVRSAACHLLAPSAAAGMPHGAPIMPSAPLGLHLPLDLQSHTPLPTATRAGKEGGVAKAAAPGADENAWRTERGAMPRHGRIPLYPARPAADNMASARGESYSTPVKGGAAPVCAAGAGGEGGGADAQALRDCHMTVPETPSPDLHAREQATAAKWKEYAEISGRLILAGSGLAGSGGALTGQGARQAGGSGREAGRESGRDGTGSEHAGRDEALAGARGCGERVGRNERGEEPTMKSDCDVGCGRGSKRGVSGVLNDPHAGGGCKKRQEGGGRGGGKEMAEGGGRSRSGYSRVKEMVEVEFQGMKMTLASHAPFAILSAFETPFREGVASSLLEALFARRDADVMAMFTAPAAVKKMQAERDAARQRMESLTKCLEDFRSTSGSLLHQLCVTDVSPLALLRLLWHPSYRSGGEIAFAKSLAHRQIVLLLLIAAASPFPPSPALARVLNRHRLHPLSAADSAALYGAGYTELGDPDVGKGGDAAELDWRVYTAEGTGGEPPPPSLSPASEMFDICSFAGAINFTVTPTFIGTTWKGWGTSLAWQGNYIGGLARANMDVLLDAVFHKSKGLGLNIVRYNIGGGNSPQRSPQFARDQQTRLKAMPGYWPAETAAFDWTADQRQRNVLFGARARGADVFEAFSNSPPWWMTVSGDVAGAKGRNQTNLQRKYEGKFANYLVSVVEKFAKYPAWNLTFDTLEPFNEPLEGFWTAGNGQEGCNVDPAAMGRVLAQTVKLLKARRLRTRVAAFDSWVESTGKALASVRGMQGAARINVHSYMDPAPPAKDPVRHTGQAYLAVRNMAKRLGKEVWVTEAGHMGRGGHPYDLSLYVVRTVMEAVNLLHASAFVYWMAYDPDIGWAIVRFPWTFPTGYSGPIPKPVLSKRYYMFKMLTSLVRPGSQPLMMPSKCWHGIAGFYHAGDLTVSVFVVNQKPTAAQLSVNLAGFRINVKGRTRAVVRRTSWTQDMAEVVLSQGKVVASVTIQGRSFVSIHFTSVQRGFP
ncbi:unnamed protein product [Closterium sp. NIES-65]|nr:unnamed protein product [Closterium sp. NIES-65]